MKSSQILINCSNLHHGGGVAVAASFLGALCRLQRTENVAVLASSLVHKNLLALGVNVEQFKHYSVVDYVGLESIWKRVDKRFAGYQTVFTVFGPCYFLRKRTRHVVGLAQPPVVYPHNVFEQSLPALTRLTLRLKHFLQALFFMRADQLVVEHQHVKAGLLKRGLFNNMPIHVVNGAVDEIYRQPSLWQTVAMPDKKNRMRFGLISKNYPHKNLQCLPLVKEILLKKYEIDAEFFVTFSDAEWTECDHYFRQSVTNVGSLTLAQCPTFYMALDGVIFPSLLECFSAVPIESMMMKKPLFASNLPFIVDCCHQHANYFDPLQPEDIAKSIDEFFKKTAAQCHEFIDNAWRFVQSYPSADERAVRYLQILQQS